MPSLTCPGRLHTDMSWEWSSQSTSKLAHRTPKLPLLSPLNSKATPEKHSDRSNVAVGGVDLRNGSDVDITTPHLSSTHVTGDPDLYYPPSFPPLVLSMYTGRQATDVTTSDSQSRDRHAQYTTLRLPVPHSHLTSAPPSPDFPSSVGSVPPTATTAEFPPSTAGLGVPSYHSGAYVYPDSGLSLAGASKVGLHPPAHNIWSGQQSSRVESTFLSSDSRTDVNLGSQLDRIQVSEPLPGSGVEPLRIRRQQPPVLRPRRSTDYEGSEVQNSSISLARVQTSRPFKTTDPFHDLSDNEAAFMDYQKESNSSEERFFSLLPPTVEPPGNASPLRHSFQTHATAGSTAHGHDSTSLPPTPTWRTSHIPFPDQRHWAEVMQSVNTSDSKAQATGPNVDRSSVEALLSTTDNSSSNASQSNLSNSQGRTNSSLVPPFVPGGSTSDGLLTSPSVTSGSDSFTAFELMSFPKPPTDVPGQQGSARPTTRSPWVKGLTLPMPTNMAIPARSIREPGTPNALPLSSASAHTIPALPLSAASPSTLFTPLSAPGVNPTFHVVQTPSRVVVTTHDSPVPSVAIPEGSQSLWTDSRPPSPARRTSSPLPSKSQLNMSSASIDGSMTAKSKYCPPNQPWCIAHLTTGVTPSYNRRISALIHAAEQLTLVSRDLASEAGPQARMSKDSDELGALGRQSEDEPAAVVGVVRIASLSCRSKALLTRAPSSGALAADNARPGTQSPINVTVAHLRLNTEDSVLGQGVHAYLSKAPSPSFTATTASPSGSTPTLVRLSPSLRRQPPARELGFFPESIGEVDDQYVLAHDVGRTGWVMTPLDVRGVSTWMDRGPKDETRPDVPFYNEKDLPRVPYPESRKTSDRSRPLPPPPLPLLPTVSPPAIPPDAHVRSQPDQMSGQLRRQESFGSNTLTRVSSLLSKLSNSTLHSLPTNPSRQSTRRSKRGTLIPPPLPPPPLPLPLTPSQMQFPRLGPHPNKGTADHELMERAGTLERMARDGAFLRQGWDRQRNEKPLPVPNPLLDEVHLYHQQIPQQRAQSSNGRGYVHKTVLSKTSSIRSIFSNRSDRSRHRIPNHVVLGINASMGGDGSGRFTELDDDEKRRRDGQVRALAVDPRGRWNAGPVPEVGVRNAGGPAPNRKQWTRRSKWLALVLFLSALIGLVVGLVIILARRNTDTDSQASSCTGSNATGRFCDIGTCYCTSLQYGD